MLFSSTTSMVSTFMALCSRKGKVFLSRLSENSRTFPGRAEVRCQNMKSKVNPFPGRGRSAPPPENTRSRRFTMWIGAEAYDFDISWEVTAIHRRHASPVPAVETPDKERRDFPD